MLRKSLSPLAQVGAKRNFNWKCNKEYMGKTLTGSYYLRRDMITDRETVDVYNHTVYNPQSRYEGLQDNMMGGVAGGAKYMEFVSKQSYRTTHDPVGYKKLETYSINFGPQHPAAHGVL